MEWNLQKELGQHLSGMDNMFFQLEHPRRLLTICSAWLFNERLDTTTVLTSLKNLCAHYPRFCLVPRSTGTCLETPIWSRPQRNWSIKDNVKFHTLDEPTQQCLQKYIASQYSMPFDFDKPLWQVHFITGLQGNQSAFLWKAHHSMSDGVGIMKAVMATTTSLNADKETRQQMEQLEQRRLSKQGQNGSPPPEVQDKGTWLTDKAKHSIGTLWVQVMAWFVWVWHTLMIIQQQVYHELWTASLFLEPLLLLPIRLVAPMNRDMYYDQDQTFDKLIGWTHDMAMADIHKIRYTLGGADCTVNDVMLMIFGRTIGRYIKQQQQKVPSTSLRVIIPLSFRLPTDWSMKNVVTGNMVKVDTGNNDTTTATLLYNIHRRMMSVKQSVMPFAIYHLFVQIILRYFPFLMMPLWLQHWYTDLPVAVFTNIAGPTESTFFGGNEMERFHVLPPQAGKGSISVGLVSYCDKVNVSMLTDNHPAYPDLANRLCQLFVSEFNAVLAEANSVHSNSISNCK
ncbi:wax ester synthase-like acyl-CoA acyltransferase domain-containing protein [Chlamydoabsidia padenii]|nr:wax ester synthase-like acyl-CoA acyltransferase domain-containing protein [Chlamydoabsidia padenii]